MSFSVPPSQFEWHKYGKIKVVDSRGGSGSRRSCGDIVVVSLPRCLHKVSPFYNLSAEVKDVFCREEGFAVWKCEGLHSLLGRSLVSCTDHLHLEKIMCQ